MNVGRRRPEKCTEARCEAQSRSDIPPFHCEALRARIWRDPFGQTEEKYLGEPDMRWQNERRSDNVEDRRGISAGQVAIGGGIGTILIVLVMSFLTGADPRVLMQRIQVAQPGAARQKPAARSPEEERQADFVRATLAMTEDVWTDLFARYGRKYQEPHLILFSDHVNTEGCGLASTAVGPFYCPADQRVYIDLAFYDELKKRFHAPGEFAQAYVIAHEIGHHVQNLLGTSEKVTRMQRR